MDFILCVIGTVLFIEGLPYAAVPDKMRRLMELIKDTPEASLRRVGFIMIFSGLMLVYLGGS